MADAIPIYFGDREIAQYVNLDRIIYCHIPDDILIDIRTEFGPPNEKLTSDEYKNDSIVEKDDKIKVYYTVEKLETEDQEWNGGRGYISTEMIKEHMWEPEEGVVMLYCGPPPMCKAMKNQLLAIGYPESSVLKF